MAGTFTGKVLAEGQIASSKGTLYTVPGSTVAKTGPWRSRPTS